MSQRTMKIQSLSAKEVQFGFGERMILDRANCEFPQDVIRLCAPSGAGKSCVLKLLAGLLEPSQGSFLINGEPVNEMSFEEFLPYRLQIGYGFELGGLLNNRTLYENLALPLQYHKLFDEDEIRERALDMLGRFNLLRDQNQRPSAVSGGQRKATCVARALITRPQIMILDDPTTGLSLEAKRALGDWLKEERQKQLRYVLISTDDQDWFRTLKPRDLWLEGGQLKWASGEKKSAA